MVSIGAQAAAARAIGALGCAIIRPRRLASRGPAPSEQYEKCSDDERGHNLADPAGEGLRNEIGEPVDQEEGDQEYNGQCPALPADRKTYAKAEAVRLKPWVGHNSPPWEALAVDAEGVAPRHPEVHSEIPRLDGQDRAAAGRLYFNHSTLQ